MEKGEFLQNITEEKRQIRHIEAENIDQEKFDFYAKDPVDLRFVGCTFRNVTVSESEARLSQFKDCKFYGCDTRSVQDRSVLPMQPSFLLMPPSGSRSAERASTFPPT